MESDLYAAIKPIGIPIIPLAPGETNSFDPTQEVLPCIFYARKQTIITRDMSMSVVCSQVEADVIVYGSNYTQAHNIADQIFGLLDNYTSPSNYLFALKDQHADTKYPDAIHCIYSVFLPGTV